MKQLAPILAGLALLLVAGIVYAAPVSTPMRNIVPETDNTYDNGTSTARWKRIFGVFASSTVSSADTVCVGTDCRTTWPSLSGGFDFTPQADGNATTTRLLLNGGLLVTGSTTLNGNATTTGNHAVNSLTIDGTRFTNANISQWTNDANYTTLTSFSGVYPITYNSGTGAFSLAFGTTTANTWSQLQTLTSGFLSQASSTVMGNFTAVLGANGIAQLNDSASASAIWGTNIGLISEGGLGRIVTSGNVPIVFHTNGTRNTMTEGTNTEWMRITIAGLVGIGTSSPFAALSVAGASGIVAEKVTATSTTATSSLQRTSITGAVDILGEYFTNLTNKIISVIQSAASVVLTGAWDFGGATSLEIPNSTNPTVDAAGEVAINTTAASSSLRYHDGTAERALYPDHVNSYPIASTTALVQQGSYVIGATSVVFGNGTSSTTPASCVTAPTFSSLTTAFNMGDRIFLAVGSTGTTTVSLATLYRPNTILGVLCRTNSASAPAWLEIDVRVRPDAD